MLTQQDINAIRAQRLADTHDPFALMANTQTLFHPDQSSLITYLQHPQPNNNFIQQPSFNTNYMPQPMQNFEDSSDSTTAMNKALALIAKAFKINTIPTNNNQRIGQNAVQNPGIQIVKNINGLSVVSEITNQYGNGNVVTASAEGHYASNCTVKPRKSDKVLQLQRRGSLCQQLHSKAKETGCCLSSKTDAYCSKGISRDPTHSRGI
ncbi:hypothetical protein Tco_1433346 [Tanacetum coccineum]